ncbi:hypothetical protein [Cohnella fermenti]|uniref:Uncharacterized protein n=1 Tax=Cohnella fermenti TaxID=2565925 RepID=A0A4S4BTF1_9BACL|nr:hypothetical protein [Cohnella fermenti]THF78343.1 hypothetical protein E6C55_14080 [Cohnella fermenti]
MSGQDRSGTWERYMEAKRQAFSEEERTGEPRTLEELEEAIARAAESSGIPETGMPPRASVHPSNKGSWSRWFYRLLVLVFFALVAGLIWWGNRSQG